MAARDEGGTRKVDWFARILDASNKRKAALVEEAGESRVLEFRDPASSTYYFLHPSTYTPGKWQLSVIATDGSGPLSHQEYSDRRKAIEEVGSTGHYRVTDRRNPNMPLRFRDLNVGAIFVFASEAGVYSKAAGGTLAWQGARGPWEKISPREYIYANRPESPQVFKVGTINAEVVKAGDAQGPQRFAGRVRNPVLRYKKPLPDARQVEVDVWEERDRLSIVAYDSRFGARRKVIAEWWDDDARQMFEDGFFNARARGGLKQSVVEYLQDMGMVNKSRLFNPLNEREADELLDGALSDLAHAKTLKGPDGKAMQAYVFGKASKAGHAVAVYGEDWRQKDQGGKLSHVSRRLGQRAARMDRAYHGQLRGGNPSMLILGNPPTANSENYFSIASGLYWFAADYHSGQTSVIYSVLSRLDYKPGASERGPAKDDFEAREVYAYLRKLDKKRGGADSEAERLLAEVKAASSRDTNPRGVPRRQPRETRANWTAFIEDTLIPDLEASGSLYADDFKEALFYMRGGGTKEEAQAWANWMRDTLIPDTKDSGREFTAKDLVRARGYVKRARGVNPASMLILGNPGGTAGKRELEAAGFTNVHEWEDRNNRKGRWFEAQNGAEWIAFLRENGVRWHAFYRSFEGTGSGHDPRRALTGGLGDVVGDDRELAIYCRLVLAAPGQLARTNDGLYAAQRQCYSADRRGGNPLTAKEAREELGAARWEYRSARNMERMGAPIKAAWLAGSAQGRAELIAFRTKGAVGDANFANTQRVRKLAFALRKRLPAAGGPETWTGNPSPGTTATVTYSPEFQEFTVTTRDAARKVLGTYFTNDHADALGTARREAETVLDRTKRRPPNPLNQRETVKVVDRALAAMERSRKRDAKGNIPQAAYAGGEAAAYYDIAADFSENPLTGSEVQRGRRMVALGARQGRRAARRGEHAFAAQLFTGGASYAEALGRNVKSKATRRGFFDASARLDSQAMKHHAALRRAVNPGPCPHGCPPGVWRDPEFQRELAAYKKRHGSVPAEIRQINVPAGFPKYLSVYGRVPELKYDAPAHSTKGRRIHHFGKNGAKHTQPFAVTSAARGPKFLALVGGNFKAKPDWIFD